MEEFVNIQIGKDMMEFEVDTTKEGPYNRKTGIPFYLKKQDATLIVFWGDGTRSVLTSSDYTDDDATASIHEYAAPGRYKVKICIEASKDWSSVYISALDCPDTVFEHISGLFNAKTECIRLFKRTLVAITSPLPHFRGTLQYTLADPSRITHGIRLRHNFSFLFIHSAALEFVTPKAFDNIKDSISFSYCFYGCRSLKEVPKELFRGCVDVLSYAYCFYGCYDISSIPESLFKDSHKCQSFKGTFKDCIALKEVPENTFHGNYSADTFAETFQNCIALKEIPEKLFSKCPMVTSFSCTFENCIGIEEVPENLFKNCSNAIYFRSIFSKSGLKSIPKKLFEGKKRATIYSYAFSWCMELREVPEELFQDSIYVKDFSGCFYGCRNIEKVGRRLFARNIYATKFSHCFYGCKSLKDISVEIASRIVDTLHLFVQKNESSVEMHRELIVPRMSYTAKLAHLKEEELGIVVTEKAFLKATLYALLQSMLRIVHHD